MHYLCINSYKLQSSNPVSLSNQAKQKHQLNGNILTRDDILTFCGDPRIIFIYKEDNMLYHLSLNFHA